MTNAVRVGAMALSVISRLVQVVKLLHQVRLRGPLIQACRPVFLSSSSSFLALSRSLYSMSAYCSTEKE